MAWYAARAVARKKKVFPKRRLDHVNGLDPTLLDFTQGDVCRFGMPPTAELTRRKVWGERCSGTNFVDALLARHFGALGKKGGQWEWKHGLARINSHAEHRLNVFVVRDPYTWAQSFYRNPWHLPVRLRNRTFSEFIREEWVGVFYDQGKYTPERPEDRHPTERRRFVDIWEMRSVKLRHALVAAAQMPNGVFASYEQVSSRSEDFVNELGRRFDLDHPEFNPITDYKGEARRSYDKTKYQKMSQADREYITSRLDAPLEHFCGYLPED